MILQCSPARQRSRGTGARGRCSERRSVQRVGVEIHPQNGVRARLWPQPTLLGGAGLGWGFWRLGCPLPCLGGWGGSCREKEKREKGAGSCLCRGPGAPFLFLGSGPWGRKNRLSRQPPSP